MSRDQIEISDTCKCGATFKVQGGNIYSTGQHKKWLEAHTECRKDSIVVSGQDWTGTCLLDTFSR